MEIIARNLMLDRRTGIVYGYCNCGREIKHSNDHTDKICPLCGAKIKWSDVEKVNVFL